jgi:hypothetical protein
MTPAPTFASVCHLIDGAAITDEELRELAALIKQRSHNGGWVYDGSYPWLVTPMERERVAKRAHAARTEGLVYGCAKRIKSRFRYWLPTYFDK